VVSCASQVFNATFFEPQSPCAISTLPSADGSYPTVTYDADRMRILPWKNLFSRQAMAAVPSNLLTSKAVEGEKKLS
jgi:hypothetical protein